MLDASTLRSEDRSVLEIAIGLNFSDGPSTSTVSSMDVIKTGMTRAVHTPHSKSQRFLESCIFRYITKVIRFCFIASGLPQVSIADKFHRIDFGSISTPGAGWLIGVRAGLARQLPRKPGRWFLCMSRNSSHVAARKFSWDKLCSCSSVLSL